jgi:DNA-binding helix-turn-helix protein
MKKAAYNILPGTEEILKTMGEQIKLARLRRRLSLELTAGLDLSSSQRGK